MTYTGEIHWSFKEIKKKYLISLLCEILLTPHEVIL